MNEALPSQHSPVRPYRDSEKGLRMSEDKTIVRVIVADDEAIIADTLAMILNRNGYEATAVYSGEQAVEEAKKQAPDMLISDVVMRGITGIEAAVLIREFAPNCRILLFSGQASTFDQIYGGEAKWVEFEILAKPIHPQHLLDRLRKPV